MHHCQLNAHESNFLDNRTHLRFRLMSQRLNNFQNCEDKMKCRRVRVKPKIDFRSEFFKVKQNFLTSIQNKNYTHPLI